MEFCINWNQLGSLCMCPVCEGPWIETERGFWKHAFDTLLFSHIRPLRHVIDYEEPETEVQSNISDSPVSSISDQYSTDSDYFPSSGSDTSTFDYSETTDEIISIESDNNEVFETNSDTFIVSSDSEGSAEIIDDFSYAAPPNSPNPEYMSNDAAEPIMPIYEDRSKPAKTYRNNWK